MKGDTMESTAAKNNIKVNMMQSNKQTFKIKSTDSNKLNFECQHCDFNCPSKVTLNKHMNTNHALKGSYKECEAIQSISKCSLCEDKFKSLEEFRSHIQEHLDEIEGINIPSLTNEHDLFECNLCSFESGNEESVREHLIDHVNQSEEVSNITVSDKEKPKRRLIDEYDDEGNYIGDDPRFMECQSESDTEDDN